MSSRSLFPPLFYFFSFLFPYPSLFPHLPYSTVKYSFQSLPSFFPFLFTLLPLILPHAPSIPSSPFRPFHDHSLVFFSHPSFLYTFVSVKIESPHSSMVKLDVFKYSIEIVIFYKSLTFITLMLSLIQQQQKINKYLTN